MIRTFLFVCMALMIGLTVGFGSVYYMLEDGLKFSAYKNGVWYGWPNSGAADIDPYWKANLARSGHLQLGRAEGVIFWAQTDSQGSPLAANCTYKISGSTPKASVWTLRAELVTFRHQRDEKSYLVSSQINYARDGHLQISASPLAQPGNWLPLSGADASIRFIMTFYDTNAFVIVGNEVTTLPSIEKVSCL